MTADFNRPLTPSTPKVYEAREKPERGTPIGLIRKPLAEPEMVPVRKQCEACGQFTKGNAAICASCKRSEDRANWQRAQ